MKKFFVVFFLVILAYPAMGQQMIWEPIHKNPYLLSQYYNSAQIQDPHGFLQAEPREVVQRDPMETFKQRLTDRLFYKLSQQIVDAAFGEDSLEAGEYVIDGYIVNITTDGGGIKATITDDATGNTTTVEVPYY